MAMTSAVFPLASPGSSGGRLVAPGGRELPLLGASLAVEARAGLARVVVEQRFRNPHAEPLVVTYRLPLPHDAAVSGFEFLLDGRRVVGEVARREQARERYEEALLEGRTAALLEQERGSLFAQEVGNLPPGAELVARLVLDQRLAWLDEGAWEWRFPTVVAPRYLGAPGRVGDAGRVTQDVAEPGGARPALALSLRVEDALAPGARPESPSHAIAPAAAGEAWRVALSEGSAASLDRDVVVRWAVSGAEPGVALALGRPPAGRPHAGSSYGLLAVVPPRADAAAAAVGRDLVLLLDVSGSMAGAPVAQLRRVAAALVESLAPGDTLEMVAFAQLPQRWRGRPAVLPDGRKEALEWIARLEAGGATEMREAILAALAPLRPDAQRQVVLLTDGLIGFEEEVVRAVRERLPRGSRVHAVGVGPSVNRSLTAPVARAGRGLEAVIGLDEEVAPAVARLLGRTRAPLVVDLELSGDALLEHAPRALPDLFAGAPALLSLRLRPEGGALRVRGRVAGGGAFERAVEVPAVAPGSGSEGVITLFGRERVEDLEAEAAAGGARGELDGEIERVGLELGIATRCTSWVAVAEEPGVDPGAPVRRVRQPQELPAGLSAEGLGLRAPAAAALGAIGGTLGAPMMARRMRSAPAGRPAPAAPAPAAPQASILGRVMDFFREASDDGGLDLGLDAGPATGPRRLRGRVVLLRGDRLVVELEVEGETLRWEPASAVGVVWADGSSRTATLAPEGSTRPGEIARGLRARLVLTLPAGAPAEPPVELLLLCAGEALLVALGACP